MEKKLNNILVLAKMSEDGNPEIQLSPLQNMKRAQSGKDGWGEVTIAIPNEVVQNLLTDSGYYVGGFLIAKREEFDKYREKIKEEENPKALSQKELVNALISIREYCDLGTGCDDCKVRKILHCNYPGHCYDHSHMPALFAWDVYNKQIFEDKGDQNNDEKRS
jgi:hypothetical protein